MSLVEYFKKELSDQLGLALLFFEFILDTAPFGSSFSSSGGSNSSSSENMAWRFCNQSYDIDWNGTTWYASAIKSSRVLQSREINKDAIQLTFPRTDEFAQMFIGIPPEFIVFLNIYRGHATQPDDEYAVYWKGRVSGGKGTEDEIIISNESVFTSLRRYGLRARYTRNCRHNVYDNGCKANPADFGVPAIVTSATTYTLTSSDFGSSNNESLLGGMVESIDGELRFIVDHSGDTITLWRPLQSILDQIDQDGSASVMVYPGCDKSTDDCVNIFNNILNNGSFPRFNRRNPFDGRSIV